MSKTLMVASASILVCLGGLHLVLTYVGEKLLPRDPSLRYRMLEISPVISRQMTMWGAWIGFNVSHSLSLLLFGLVYGYLVLFHPGSLFGSWFLLLVGFAYLSVYLVLARAYWFNGPVIGVALALALFAMSVVAARAQPAPHSAQLEASRAILMPI